jgi:hypothetical protein
MIRTRAKAILLPALLAAWLCCPSPAAADTGGTVDISALEDGLSDIPPAELAGWFLTFDPSNQWTSAANIETMVSWLLVAEEISIDPSLLAQLEVLEADNVPSPANSQTDQSLVPEPGTLELLGGALAILALCARKLCLATRGLSIPPFSSTS